MLDRHSHKPLLLKEKQLMEVANSYSLKEKEFGTLIHKETHL